ncbi:signal peptidase I [uncultured Jatrophihabitans sp.]|uniref:signal peptidase I n=1 Tax=uncultured Jatrophihabitans sp. TaxID=1610747 RepID=UPI0035C94839
MAGRAADSASGSPSAVALTKAPPADQTQADPKTAAKPAAKTSKTQAKADVKTAEGQQKPDRKAERAKAKEDKSTTAQASGGAKKGAGGAGWLRRGLRLAIIVAIVATGAVLLRVYVVQPYYIPSESMEPTLHGCTGCNDDHILVNKLSYRSGTPSEGDIVVFDRPPGVSAPDKVLIKRVIGLPGDKVQLSGGQVYLNGLHIEESYVNQKCGENATRPLDGRTSWTVPAKDIFVMGDNRCDSDDSRVFGPIPIKSVLGRAFAIIWPINRVRIL